MNIDNRREGIYGDYIAIEERGGRMTHLVSAEIDDEYYGHVSISFLEYSNRRCCVIVMW